MEIIGEGVGNLRVACGDSHRQRCEYACACWKTKCVVRDERADLKTGHVTSSLTTRITTLPTTPLYIHTN